MVELGAQSTRPGAAIISAEEEYSRLAPVLDGLLEEMKSGVIRISLDSFYPEVINKVLQHYPIVCVNDVKGELDGETLMAIAAKNCKLVVMHSLSVPAKKGEHLPDDEPAITQINDWIDRTLQRLLACGFREELVIFDPGIGFGKSAYQSLDLIRCAEQIKSKGCEVMFGHSRKSCIAAFSKASAIERDLETIAMSNYLSSCGIDYLRVHNVKDHQRFFVAKQFIYNPSLRAQRGNLSVSTDRLPRRYAPRNDGVGRAEAKIIGIMACAHDGVVGNKGAIPWRYPEEFRHFRETIGDCPIIVGRKTFDGLPDSILKNRVSIVFSRAKKFKTRGAIVVSSLDEFFALDILAKTDKVFLIGGAELANFFLEQELVSEFILTKVKGSYVGDAFLNLRAFDNWASAVISEGPDYSIYKLTRVI
jgi:dihydropteroate synthase